MKTISSFVIGGASSGSGKTTLTLGLLRALSRRGLHVAPFKCGPDYIDPLIHQKAAQRACYNLDAYFMNNDPAAIRRHFDQVAAPSDISIVEGVMGLFDGYDRSIGSSAEMAKIIGLPVVLVIDAKAVAYSIAAPLYGFKHFDKSLNIAGVVFNRVGSEHHYQLLADAARSIGMEPLGYIPKDKGLEISSRHLGLSLDPTFDWEGLLNYMADVVEKYVRIDEICSRCTYTPQSSAMESKPTDSDADNKAMPVVAVARDEAFNFTYQHNIDCISARARVVYFSPIHDTELPHCDLLYLPGGYPEFFAPQLASNESMKRSIHHYISTGGKVWAECGGMMYLCRSLIAEDGTAYPMVGILATDATMEQKKMTLGYRTFTLEGKVFRGHEFHYSHLTQPPCASATTIYDSKEQATNTGLWRIGNMYAGYTHIYWHPTLTPLDLFTQP